MNDSISRFSSSSNSAFFLRKKTPLSAAPTVGLADSIKSPIADVTGMSSNSASRAAIATPSPTARENTDFNAPSHTITRMDSSSSAAESLTSISSSQDASTKSSAGASFIKKQVEAQKSLPHQALSIFFDKEAEEVNSFLERANSEVAFCDGRIGQCQEQLAAIHPTLLDRLQAVATREEFRQVLETTSEVHSREINNLFYSIKEYQCLRLLSGDIITKASSLMAAYTSSLNRARYFVRGVEHLQQLDYFAQKIHTTLQQREENLTQALREKDPQKQDDFFRASNMGLSASRFLRYASNAFREKNQAALATYNDRAACASLALKSYHNAAECEVQALPLHHQMLSRKDPAIAVPRVMLAAQRAAYRAAYCYEYASTIQTPPCPRNQKESLSAAEILRPIYKKIGDLFTAGFHQLLEAKTGFVLGDRTHAAILEFQAEAMLGVAESQRVRITISTPEIGRQSLEGTISQLNQIEAIYHQASGLYEKVFSLDRELKEVVQVQDSEKAALVKQQIKNLLQQLSQMKSQAQKNLRQLLLDPRRVPVGLLRQLGY